MLFLGYGNKIILQKKILSLLNNKLVSDLMRTIPDRIIWRHQHIECRRHLLAAKIINSGFIAQMIILFVLLYYRNSHYGNEYYDKVYRYEIF